MRRADPVFAELVDAARAARENAYAPYSGLKVGAAVRAGGRVFAGCNVENASYPVGICAERGALCAAVAAGCHEIEAVVVVSARPIAPCGMCRQALAELASGRASATGRSGARGRSGGQDGRPCPVLLVGDDAERLTDLDELLPLPFTSRDVDCG